MVNHRKVLSSQDKKKNPLSHDQKMMFMKLMFPKHRSAMIKSKARNALEALVQLHDMKKYSRVVMVVGSDRVADFNTLLNRYNGEDVKHGFYQFDEIKVVSAGERDPDACLLYTSPSPRDRQKSRMPSSA